MSPRRHRGEIEGVVDFIDNADVRFISRLAAEEPEVTEGPCQKFGNLRQVAFRNQFSEFVNRYHKWNIPTFFGGVFKSEVRVNAGRIAARGKMSHITTAPSRG